MINLHGELLLRILVGTVLGAVIGYERDLHARPAGLRTHTIVALASATFMVISTRFVYFQHYAAGDLVAVDTSRIAASVVSGIGFLGGGAILRTGINIQGLTTAAALWLVAAIGMAAGGGMYVESVSVTFAGVVCLTLLRRFEDQRGLLAHHRVTLVLDQSGPPIAAVMAAFGNLGGSISHEDYEKGLDDQKVRLAFELRVPLAVRSQDILQVIEAEPGLRSIRIERL
jgi:putative Mg2+ transporter-C (MgtC) family protein